jgi:succinoglycan biosynthesis protein ExoM
MNPTVDVVVTVATYKRPETLRKLLVSLQNQTGLDSVSYHIVIVDNDPQLSAAETVENFANIATYVSEPVPGIAAARNAGLDAAEIFRPKAVAFIDDDEVASSNWLSELLEVWNNGEIDVVTGPVEYELPPGTEFLREAAPYFRKIERPNLAPVPDVATNNTLVSAGWFSGSEGLRFSETYSLTGGSDVELFYRLQAQGGSCVWAASALVVESVPPSRTTPRWIRQRDLRNGQLQARVRVQVNCVPRSQILIEGILRIIKGSVTLVVSSPSGSARIQAWRTLQTGRGYIKAITGQHFREYASLRTGGDHAASKTRSVVE